jgi:diguanylate cyclase (GGDEF)-like protein
VRRIDGYFLIGVGTAAVLAVALLVGSLTGSGPVDQRRVLVVPTILLVALLLLLSYELTRRARGVSQSGRLERDARDAQNRVEELTQLMRLSEALAGAVDAATLRRTVLSEIPPLIGTDAIWVITRLNGWQLLIGEPAAPDAPLPIGLVSKPEAWETFPLVVGGKTLGILGVQQPATQFTDTQRRILNTAATLIATAMKNIQLFNRVRELSTIDALTRCLVRQHGIEALEREMRRARRSQSPLSVAVFDIDHFKQLNDTHGHLAGDRALAMVGRVLKDALRAGDIACRYGGEEFLLIFPDTTLAGCVRAVENLRRRITESTIKVGTSDLHLSASFGVSAVEPAEDDPSGPILRADAAMYEAKRSGRNRVVAAPVPPPGSRSNPAGLSATADSHPWS